MASKIKVTPQKEEMLEKEGPETPLLELSDVAVKELIRNAKKRGYVTHDQINALLSSEDGQVRANRGHPGEVERDGRQRGRDQRGRA